jgi:hypothetical protein
MVVKWEFRSLLRDYVDILWEKTHCTNPHQNVHLSGILAAKSVYVKRCKTVYHPRVFTRVRAWIASATNQHRKRLLLGS